MPQPALTEQQLEALRRYAGFNGRTWRFQLRRAWDKSGPYIGVPEALKPVIHNLRYREGNWLAKFKFPPKQPAVPEKPVRPLSNEEFEQLFHDVELKIIEVGCDGSRRETERWLSDHGHHPEGDRGKAVLNWLAEHGGYCDCEVLQNSQMQFEDELNKEGK